MPGVENDVDPPRSLFVATEELPGLTREAQQQEPITLASSNDSLDGD